MKRLASEHGFSILEVMFGAAVFTLGMLGVAGLLTSAIRGAAFSADLSEANELAAGKLEELLMAPYDPLDDPAARLDDDDADGTAGLADDTGVTADGVEPGVGRNGTYTVLWNVADSAPVPNMKTIRVFVTWSVKGEARRISFTTYRAEVM
ncbi:MAG: hypothetical protein AB1634_15020 [Thermodesulfobacteriota bacterium]